MPRPFASHAARILAAGLLASPALAAWAPQGNPLSNMPGHQFAPLAARYAYSTGFAAPTGLGMVVVWNDTRLDGGDLYYSVVTELPPPDPAPGTDGTPLVVGAGNQFQPAVAAVNSPIVEVQSLVLSPVVVAWTDWPVAGAPMQVRAKRVADADWGATGVPVHDAGPTSGTDAAVGGDGTTGAVVAWTETATGLRATRAQRLDFTGTRLWGANGVPLGTDTTVSSRPQVVPVPGGGAYVLRVDRRNGALTGGGRALALFRVDGAGALAAGWPAEGLLIGDLTVASHRLLADGIGGAYVIWQQSEILSNDALGQGVRMTRILAEGSAAPGWTIAGTRVAVRADGHVGLGHADVAPDGSVVLGLTYLQVVGGGPSLSDLVADRMLPDGQHAPGWPVTGLDLCFAPGEQYGVQVISSGTGPLAVWSDERSGTPALFGVRLLGDGSAAPGWTAGGQLLCDTPVGQGAIVLAPATGGGAVFAWLDYRDFGTTQSDIYAQTVNAAGQVSIPTEPSSSLKLSAARPQPASSSVRLTLSGPEGEARVEVLDLQGRSVARWSQVQPAAGSLVLWDLRGADGGKVAPGIYHVVVRLRGASATRRVVVVP